MNKCWKYDFNEIGKCHSYKHENYNPDSDNDDHEHFKWAFKLADAQQEVREQEAEWSVAKHGKVTSKVTATAGDSIAAEITFYDENGRKIGFWGYGNFDPSGEYQGEQD